MRETITDDGSVTLYNDNYQDHYHTKSGAIEEVFGKFIRPANIAGRKEVRVLDIGFGLGYTFVAAIDEFLDAGGERIEIIALEKDGGVLAEVQNLNPPLKNFEIAKILARDGNHSDERIHATLIIGDAVATIKDLPENHFDVIFADGFSPAKNPELWTNEFFKEVFRVSKKGAIVTTYSYARSVRENLRAAGFSVSDGPIIGRRSPSTIAVRPGPYS